jgi:hypothetical protein
MRTLIGLGALLAILLPAAPASAFSFFSSHDLNAPWCLAHSDLSGNVECSYYSYRQCMETRLGVGGSCQPNPAARQAERPRKKRDRYQR